LSLFHRAQADYLDAGHPAGGLALQKSGSALEGDHYDVVVARTGDDGFFRAHAEVFDFEEAKTWRFGSTMRDDILVRRLAVRTSSLR
jgi:hypothetical protein